MQCSYCNTEMDAAATHCPGCGRIRDLPDAPKWRVIALALVVAVLAGMIGFAIFRTVRQVTGLRNARLRVPAQGSTYFPVQHGAVVNGSQLPGRGKLYFVAIGRQAIPIKALTTHYKTKFNLDVNPLPPIRTGAGDCPDDGKHCAPERLLFTVARAYPEVAADPDAVVVAITDEDLYSEFYDERVDSYQLGRRLGIISSYQAGFGENDKVLSSEQKLAKAEQVLTNRVAHLYFGIPNSHDPSSLMRMPFASNGGADDLYESDLHSEYSVNGLWEDDDTPCLGIRYSYKTGVADPIAPSVIPCGDMQNSVRSEDEETFQIEVFNGVLTQRSMDLREKASPEIQFRRGYMTRYPSELAFGLGANVSYNTWASSDGIADLSFIEMIHEDGTREHFTRTSEGKGFRPDIVLEGSSGYPYYKAQMTWEKDHFVVKYLDGSAVTILPCATGDKCYWSGFQDSRGHRLAIERGAGRELKTIKSSDGKQVECRTDDRGRVVSAKDSKGRVVTYDYDREGRLAKVHRWDGQTAVYEYTRDHNMAAFSVSTHPGAAAKLMVKTEYDADGRVVGVKLADGRSFRIHYENPVISSSFHSAVVDFAGTALEVFPGEDNEGYIAKARPIRYHAVLAAKKEGPSGAH